jgi:hypothetical protein
VQHWRKFSLGLERLSRFAPPFVPAFASSNEPPADLKNGGSSTRTVPPNARLLLFPHRDAKTSHGITKQRSRPASLTYNERCVVLTALALMSLSRSSPNALGAEDPVKHRFTMTVPSLKQPLLNTLGGSRPSATPFATPFATPEKNPRKPSVDPRADQDLSDLR